MIVIFKNLLVILLFLVSLAAIASIVSIHPYTAKLQLVYGKF